MSQIFKSEWDWSSIQPIQVCPYHHVKYNVYNSVCSECPKVSAMGGYRLHNSCFYLHGYTPLEWQTTINKLRNKIYSETGNKVEYAKLWHAIEDNALSWHYYKMFVNLLPRRPTLRLRGTTGITHSKNNKERKKYEYKYYDENNYDYSKARLSILEYDRKCEFDYDTAKQRHADRYAEKMEKWRAKHNSRISEKTTAKKVNV